MATRRRNPAHPVRGPDRVRERGSRAILLDMARPATVDAYLATVTGPKRRALARLRATIRALAPRAEECISYSMPAFRLDGKVIAGFLATGTGCSYYPFSGTTLATLASELAHYDHTKSALHFDPAKGLPKPLVRKLLATRIAETPGRAR